MHTKSGIQKIKGYWEFPKGGVLKQDISIEHAIKRELFEEIDMVDVSIINQMRMPLFFRFLKMFPKQLVIQNKKRLCFIWILVVIDRH
jgi:8-oxo-dGTP pyrophosphatase MutT (NUDIX family)